MIDILDMNASVQNVTPKSVTMTSSVLSEHYTGCLKTVARIWETVHCSFSV